MANSEWNGKSAYLRDSRRRWFNDDYLEFFLKSVLRIDSPVRVADFACGLGYLASHIMPYLPEGSDYTGYDNAPDLIRQAERDFAQAPFAAQFIELDLVEQRVPEKYDLVACQAFLMHLQKPEEMLRRMIEATKPGGLVLCVETNWNVANAAMYVDGLDVDANCNLGVLAKLWKRQREENGIDRCIGTKLPAMMQKLGLCDVSMRINDCARFLNPYGDPEEYREQLQAFRADGWGREMGEEEPYVRGLLSRGVTEDDARLQYRCEKEMNDHVRNMGESLMALTLPPMFLSFGRKPE